MQTDTILQAISDAEVGVPIGAVDEGLVQVAVDVIHIVGRGVQPKTLKRSAGEGVAGCEVERVYGNTGLAHAVLHLGAFVHEAVFDQAFRAEAELADTGVGVAVARQE